MLGRVAQALGPSYFNYDWNWFRRTGTITRSRILDVGCGNGGLLRALRAQGFEHLTGVDPYIDATIVEPGLSIYRQELSTLEGLYDLVMLHHSLEHMPDQTGTLAEVNRLLTPGGHALIRVPVLAEPWRHLWGELVRSRRAAPSVSAYRTGA